MVVTDNMRKAFVLEAIECMNALKNKHGIGKDDILDFHVDAAASTALSMGVDLPQLQEELGRRYTGIADMCNKLFGGLEPNASH